MIHQYKAKGFNIVLDTYSGAVHAVDDVTYEIISLYKGHSKEEIKNILSTYNLSNDQFEEAYNEVRELEQEGMLFTTDNFSDLAIDVTKRPTNVKAICLNVAHTCNLSCEYCFAKGGKKKVP